MPQEILIPLVLIGVPAVVILAKLLGMGKAARLADDDVICARLKRERADFGCENILVAQNRLAALASDSRNGETGLVFSFGDRTVARLFDKTSAPRLEDGKNGLVLRFQDFTLPDLTIRLEESEKQAWKDRLTA